MEWQNDPMAPEEKPGEDERNDVLSNLPRSRRQRPSARREEAKAARKAEGEAGKDGSGPGPNGRAPGGSTPRAKSTAKAKAKSAAKPPPIEKVADSADTERPRRRVPPSGYATVRQPGSYGNADPDELLKSFVRSVLRRLPG